MDSTCIPGEIQVTQEVVDSLHGSHFEFRLVLVERLMMILFFNDDFFHYLRCRGPINVKGKGEMITYLLVDPPNPNQYNICREYQGA